MQKLMWFLIFSFFVILLQVALFTETVWVVDLIGMFTSCSLFPQALSVIAIITHVQSIPRLFHVWTASLIIDFLLFIIGFRRNTLSFKTVLELYLFTVIDKLVLSGEHGWGIKRCRRRVSDRALTLPLGLSSLLDGLFTDSIRILSLGTLRPFAHFAEQNQHFSEVRKAVDSTHVFFNMELAVSRRCIRWNMELGILTRRWGPWWSVWHTLALLRLRDGPKKVWYIGVVHLLFRLFYC